MLKAIRVVKSVFENEIEFPVGLAKGPEFDSRGTDSRKHDCQSWADNSKSAGRFDERNAA